MKNVGVVWKKELMDAVRDQRTLFMMIVFPLILYPLLMFGMGQMARGQETELKATTVTVAVQNGEAAPELLKELSTDSHVRVVRSSHASDDVRNGQAQAGILVADGLAAKMAAGQKVTLTLYSEENKELSSHARKLAEDAVTRYSQKVVGSILTQRGLPADLSKIVDLKQEDVSPPERKGGFLLATFLPYFLALAVANGCVTTAIDTTAGEKDRGTLETVLVSSSERGSILVGKLLAVVTTAFIATVSSAAGLAVMFLAGGSLFSSGDKAASTGLTLQISGLLEVLVLAIPVAVLLSALMMALGCFAKSVREGQMMAVSIQMAVIFGGIASMFQQTEPSIRTFMVPVLGTALVQKEILRGEMVPAHLGIAVVSSIVLAGVAIWMAVRMFGNENLMFRAK
jgi:sodium transport system permease protein